MIVGYARVTQTAKPSTHNNRPSRQRGRSECSRRRSRRGHGQEATRKAIAALSPGDVLLVTRLDRLARSTRDLLNVLDAVAKAGAGFRSLADAWADTTTPHGRVMLTVLGGLAEFERA